MATRPSVPRLPLLLAAVVAATLTVGGPSHADADESEQPCNGSARLCNLPLGEVAFATTHNSMSSRTDGFRGPNQGRTIAQQLRNGIRGFQIDAYPGFARKGRVYTDLAGPFGSQASDLSPALVATAVRIHRSLGAPPPGTPSDVYLCHTFCELGAIEMSKVARQIRTFLDRHPSEVLFLVVEDYVSPKRIREELRAAGLERTLVAFDPQAPLPTLGEMVEADTRVLVSLENGEGGPDLPNAFAGLVEETPFTFLTTTDLESPTSCSPNRGVATAPIFQFNHWVTPAGARRSKLVNSAALRDRVARCTAERGRPPTLVAVDFAEASDVLSVVDEINRGARPG